MTILDRIKIGWDVLLQLEPEIRARFAAAESSLPTTAKQPPTATPLAAAPSLKSMIAESGPLPPYSMLVGACPDRSQIFLDLTDPRPGSLLITADPESGKTRLLHSILLSSVLLNSPRRVRIALVTDDAAEFGDLPVRPHCQSLVETDSDEASSLIYELADLVEQRQKTQQAGDAVLFAVHDLTLFAGSLEADAIEQLAWLIQCGPEQRVWTIATLETDDASQLHPALASTFGTYLFGYMQNPESLERLFPLSLAHTKDLLQGSQFGLFYGEEWSPFWAPLID